MIEYILTDRTTGTKWSITIVDGEITRTSTASSAGAEPIFDDDTNPGTYWKLFMDDDELSFESTATVQDDEIELTDTVTSLIYRLVIEDGELGLFLITVTPEVDLNANQAAEALYKIELRNKDFELIKILNDTMTSAFWEWNDIGGCGRAGIRLSINPDDIKALVSPEYDIRIYIRANQTAADVLYYRGFILGYKPIDTAPSSSVQLIIDGYSAKLKRARVNRTYENMEISAIVKALLDSDVLPITSITYEEADIQETNFVIDSITFDTDAANALRILATTAKDYEWGVDRDLKFFFKKRSSTIIHTVRYRKDVHLYDELEDYGGIQNRLIIKGAGSFEDTVNNIESQTNYGLRSATITNSAISTNALSQKYGTGILAEKARIQRRVAVKKVKVEKLYEQNIPVGRLAVVKEPVAAAQKYGAAIAIYGNGILYGGLPSFIIAKIRYSLLSNGSFNAAFNLGQPLPDIATELKLLASEIENIGNQ